MLAGCGENSKKPVLRFSDLSFTAQITYLNECFVADCEVDSDNFCAVIREPDTVSGLIFTFSDNDVTVKLNDIKLDNYERFLPFGCPVALIKKALSNSTDVTYKKRKGNYRVDGKIGKVDYCLMTSPAGIPLQLDIDDYGMTVVFNNVTCK